MCMCCQSAEEEAVAKRYQEERVLADRAEAKRREDARRAALAYVSHFSYDSTLFMLAWVQACVCVCVHACERFCMQ